MNMKQTFIEQIIHLERKNRVELKWSIMIVNHVDTLQLPSLPPLPHFQLCLPHIWPTLAIIVTRNCQKRQLLRHILGELWFLMPVLEETHEVEYDGNQMNDEAGDHGSE